MKIGVSLYSFHEYASNRLEGVKDCIQKAQEMGASGLDFIEVGLPYDDYLAYAADIRRHCQALGIEPICFCTGADFLRCEDIGQEKQEALKAAVLPVIEEVIGGPVTLRGGSTDCNIPLSLGIPALCVGVNIHEGIHTREEWVEKESLLTGLAVAIRLGYVLL